MVVESTRKILYNIFKSLFAARPQGGKEKSK